MREAFLQELAMRSHDQRVAAQKAGRDPPLNIFVSGSAGQRRCGQSVPAHRAEVGCKSGLPEKNTESVMRVTVRPTRRSYLLAAPQTKAGCLKSKDVDQRNNTARSYGRTANSVTIAQHFVEWFSMKITWLPAFAALAIGIAVGAESMRLAAVSAEQALSCRSSARAMARLELLFGTSRVQGSSVTDAEWASFLDSEVTPRFPAGLTVLHGPGQWRGNDGHLAKEQSKILVIWHEPTDRTDADIEAIRSAYKQRFDQESVMRVDGVSCVSF